MSDEKNEEIHPVEKGAKSRHFSFILYPDSLGDFDFMSYLDSLHLVGCVSPLHDKDVFDYDDDEHKQGEMKKSHYHVLVTFSGPKTRNTVLKLLGELAAFCNNCLMRVGDVSAMVRYFAHMDSPTKYQYNPEEIKAFGGFNVFKYIFTGETMYKLVNKICDLVDEKNYTSYRALIKDLRTEHFDWWCVLLEHGNIQNMVRFYIPKFKDNSESVVGLQKVSSLAASAAAEPDIF